MTDGADRLERAARDLTTAERDAVSRVLLAARDGNAGTDRIGRFMAAMQGEAVAALSETHRQAHATTTQFDRIMRRNRLLT